MQDTKLGSVLESLARDLRFGLRLLRKDAVVSAAAVVSLALAIGACTAAFSLIDALILRRLPVADPDRLIYLQRSARTDEPRFSPLFSYPFFTRVRDAAGSRMETFSVSHQTLRQAILPDSGGEEEKVRTQFVSGNAFSALGVGAALGRVLGPNDDVTRGGHQVAVISHAFWASRMGVSPAAVGQWIQVERKPYQIVGVAQSGFTGTQPAALTDVWLPNMMFNAESLDQPNWNWLQVWGRLAPGVSRTSLDPIASTVFASLDEQPARGRAQRTAASAIAAADAATGFSAVRIEFERPLLVLAAIVGVVLLIACSNVANLLLARGAARRRELAVRASIGANRRRLLQQLLMESSVLTIASAALGVVCARIAVPFIVSMLTTNENPVYLDARIDWRVVAFVAGIGGLTTLLFGLMPALWASRARPAEAIALGDRSGTSQARAARSLVTVQIAFSLMVLFVASLALRSFDRLLAVDLGFVSDRLTLLTVESRERAEPGQGGEVMRRLLERVLLMPGVSSAGISNWAFFRGWSSGGNFQLPDGSRAQTFRLSVSPHFFEAMGTRILDGRELAWRDGAGDLRAVLVNEAFVRKYLPGRRAVGQRLNTSRDGRTVTYEIVGVAANTRDGSVRGEPNPFVFELLDEAGGTLEVRSATDPATLASQLRQELPRVDPSLRLVDVTTQNALVGNTRLRERLLAVLSAFFASLGLVLAAVGLYGVLSYAVVARRREIGIRMTLGAQPSAVVRTVLAGVALAVGGGIAAGLSGGVYFAQFMRTLLFEIEPASASSLAVPVVCLLAVAFVAAWLPARRATRVDPAEALRME